VAFGINAHKAMGIKAKMGTSRFKGRPKSFNEKGSRKRRRPNAQPLVTNATINISTSLPGDYVQEAQASGMVSKYSAGDGNIVHHQY
ncbi:protein FAR1-RELATED SEQUENCE 5-like, partial [Fagus crenata]